MIQKSSHPWGNFLYARRLVIEWLTEEGHSDLRIARILSMDKMQVTLIKMTPVEK